MNGGNIREASVLKDLQGRLEKAKAEHAVIMLEKKEIFKKEQGINKKISYIKKQIDEHRREEGLIMSEHAILRYIQKVALVEPDRVKDLVITEELKRLHGILGNGEFPLGETGLSVVIKNDVIITIK